MHERPTFSAGQRRRHAAEHAASNGYGRHRHLYLQPIVRTIADQISAISLLDYGCGKGTFLEEIRALNLFTTLSGYDPAVTDFSARPTGKYDLVTCLDVLDVVEPAFLNAVMDDIASLAGGVVLFDCLTRPPSGSRFKPRSPFVWRQIIADSFFVDRMVVEFAGIDSLERAIILARTKPPSA